MSVKADVWLVQFACAGYDEDCFKYPLGYVPESCMKTIETICNLFDDAAFNGNVDECVRIARTLGVDSRDIKKMRTAAENGPQALLNLGDFYVTYERVSDIADRLHGVF